MHGPRYRTICSRSLYGARDHLKAQPLLHAQLRRPKRACLEPLTILRAISRCVTSQRAVQASDLQQQARDTVREFKSVTREDSALKRNIIDAQRHRLLHDAETPTGNAILAGIKKAGSSRFVRGKPLSFYRTGGYRNVFNDWRAAFKLLQVHDGQVKKKPQNSLAKIIRNSSYGSASSTDNLALENCNPPPVPDVWNALTVRSYIRRLTEYTPPRKILSAALLSKSRQIGAISTREDTAAEIERVFYDTASRPFLSFEVFKTALEYFYKHDLWDGARRLFVRMDHIWLEMPTQTYNIMLRAAAKRKDFHNFTLLLDNMLSRGFAPNGETWLALLAAVSPKECQVVFDEMTRNGRMNDHGVRKQAVNLMVRAEYKAFRAHDKRMSLKPFFGYMQKKYGQRWLTTRGGNTILFESAKAFQEIRWDALSRAIAEFQGLREVGFEPNVDTLHQLLYLCRTAQAFRLAVGLIDKFASNWGIHLSAKSHEKLFMHCFRHTRNLNFLRTLWVSACLKSYVTFKMQRTVLNSALRIVNNFEQSNEDQRALPFSSLAGCFLLGLDLNMVQEKVLKCSSAGKHAHMDARRSIYAIARPAVDRDISMVGQSGFRAGLAAALREAWELDDQWHRGSIWRGTREEQMALLRCRPVLDLRPVQRRSPPLRKVHTGTSM